MEDGITNFVYVSDLLARRFPSVHEGLARILSEHGIGFGVLPRTKDIWIRDYAPIQVDRDGSFSQFRYFPDYLRDGYRHLITDVSNFIPAIPEIRKCQFSDIILDGGNVVRHHDKAIVTDKVFRENQRMGRDQLKEVLRRHLRVETLIIIPTEPGDVVGHADGVARFLDENAVLVNDYRTIDGRYRAGLRRVLARAGLEMVEVPYQPEFSSSRSIPSASGCYVNYVRVGRLIVLPHFQLPEDEQARRRVERCFPDSDVRSLDCSDLSEEGGVLNCITWTLRREVPRSKCGPERRHLLSGTSIVAD